MTERKPPEQAPDSMDTIHHEHRKQRGKGRQPGSRHPGQDRSAVARLLRRSSSSRRPTASSTCCNSSTSRGGKGPLNELSTLPCATRCWRRCRACARSPFRCAATSTAPTIWCRRRCCARWPTSIRSSPAPTCRRGCSPSCATCSGRSIASAAARSRTPTAAMPRRLKIAAGADQPRRVRGIPRRARPSCRDDQREALILVGASGFSYEEAAEICGCAVGTIKSRVNRARTRLADMLSIESADDFGPDLTTRAVLAGNDRP